MTYLKKKIALITGGGTRIGKNICISLAKAGFDIAIHYNKSSKEAEETSLHIQQKFGKKSIIIEADFNKISEIKNILPYINNALGKPSLLINNAAYFKNDNIETLSSNSIEEHMRVNLFAPIYLIQDFIKQDLEDANIINILDYAILKPPSTFLSYMLSKTSLWELTKILALQLAPKIRVNAIAPGPALATPKQTAEQFSYSCNLAPLKIGTNHNEIYQTINFILSMPSLTGQLITLDGGKHLSPNDKYC